MTTISTFETLPDEIILDMCEYLYTSEVLFCFYNLNNRLNITITDFLQHVNPTSVRYSQFQFVIQKILPQIRESIQSFVYHGYWQTALPSSIHSLLFCPNLSVILPNLHTLVLRRFTGKQLFTFIDTTKDLLKLVKIDIRSLDDEVPNELLRKILAASNCRLQSVTFDQYSDSLSLTEDPNGKFTSYINIEKLIVNLKNSVALECLMALIPNVNYLQVNYSGTLNISVKNLKEMPPLLKLKDFYLSIKKTNCTYNEISIILSKMPFLKNLSLYVQTKDEHFIDGQNLSMILPVSLIHLDLFIIYSPTESNFQSDTILKTWPTDMNVRCLLSECNQFVIIYTIPCDLVSPMIPEKKDKKVLTYWKYMQYVKHLEICEAASLMGILRTVKHFRNLHSLQMNVSWESTAGSATQPTLSVVLFLPQLKQFKIGGQYDLMRSLDITRNLRYLTIDFESLNSIMKNDSIFQSLEKRLIYINICDIVDIDALPYDTIAEKFSNLVQLVLSMANPMNSIDSMILRVLTTWRSKKLFSLFIRGSVSDELHNNLRQWLVDHTHLRDEDPFVSEYKEPWLWIWF